MSRMDESCHTWMSPPCIQHLVPVPASLHVFILGPTSPLVRTNAHARVQYSSTFLSFALSFFLSLSRSLLFSPSLSIAFSLSLSLFLSQCFSFFFFPLSLSLFFCLSLLLFSVGSRNASYSQKHHEYMTLQCLCNDFAMTLQRLCNDFALPLQ